MRKFWLALIAFIGLLAVASESANADLIVNIDQVGPNVVVAGSGTLDLTGLTKFGSEGGASQLNPSEAIVNMGATPANIDLYFGVTGPTSIGFGSDTSASEGSGNFVGIFGSLGWLAVPQGYTSGLTLSDSMTFDNATFTSLGLTPGTYTYSWNVPDDSISLNIGTTTATPLPAALPLFASGLGIMGFLAKRRKRKGDTAVAAA